MSRLIARANDLAIGPNTEVTLHFSILLGTGEEVDTTRRGKPARFTVGDGRLLEGFERALFGMKAGDDEQLEIRASDGFGERNAENVRRLPRSDFAADAALEAGLVISFNTPDGDLAGVVRALDGTTVEVDFNHPLAGRDLVFDVSILRVEPVSPGK
ncbi:MAG: peptidylprolyl isomerase [Gammaproteobacteria bacterium]|nr:peptidylprolyl isomerase [Gammaproteobacteria bacterium]